MAKSSLITLTEFAKILGVTQQRVSKAAKENKFNYTTEGRKKLVDPKKAKKQWDVNTSELKKNPSGKTKTKVIEKPADVPKFQGLTTADADRKEKFYKANLAELKYQEQAGQLVRADEVERVAFETGRKVRDKILSISGRLAHELAAITDPHKLEVKLQKELTAALMELSKRK